MIFWNGYFLLLKTMYIVPVAVDKLHMLCYNIMRNENCRSSGEGRAGYAADNPEQAGIFILACERKHRNVQCNQKRRKDS